MPDDTKDAVKDKFAQRFENDDPNQSVQTDKASDNDENKENDENDENEKHAEQAQTDRNKKRAKNAQTDENAQSTDRAKNGETVEQSKQSQPVRIKDAWPNHSVYLPNETADTLSATYKKLDWQLDAEYGLDIKKTRHYYPLIIQLGLERLDELEQEEVKERIERIEPEAGYFD